MTKNFSYYEMELLTALINKYKDVIDCKETNVTALALKEITWGKVADEFNAVKGIMKRSVKQLRMKHKNMKRDAKRKKAQDRNEILKTLEGNAPIIENGINEKLAELGALSQPLSNSLDGMTHQGDNQSSPEEDNTTVHMTFEVVNDLSAVIKQEVEDDMDSSDTLTAPVPSEHLSVTAPVPPERFSVPAPAPPKHLPAIAPAPPKHLPAIAPAPPKHLPATAPAPPKHLPAIAPAPPGHFSATTSVPSEHLLATSPASPSCTSVPSKETTEVLPSKDRKTPGERAAHAIKEKAVVKVMAIKRELDLKERETEVTINSIRLKDKLMQEEHDVRMNLLKEEHALRMKMLASKLQYYESSAKSFLSQK